MKKLVRMVLLLFISFRTLFILFGFARTPYIHAADTFILTNGQFENASGESEEYRVIGQDLFTQLTINISESGEVSGEAEIPFNFELNGDSYSGSAAIKLNGTYDADKKSIKGNFSYNHSRVKIHTFTSGNVAELKGTKNLPKSSFSGKVDGDGMKIEFPRLGRVTYAGVSPGGVDKTEQIYDVPDIEYQPGVDTGARFASIQGEVEMYPDGNPDDRRFAKMGVKIEPGMHIFTGEDSNVIITFADMSTYKLPPNSEIVIKNFKSKSQLMLIGGKIWSNFKKIANGETIEVQTSQAVLGIKGTTFVVEERKGTSTLKVINGSILFTSRTSGRSEMIQKGETMMADKKGLGKKGVFDPVEEEKKWTKPAKTDYSPAVIVVVLLGALVIALYIYKKIKK
ncbi:FecR domain-containing protein [Candidatus Roizmanbacteria bacterium]|nr:FecR domain-containing protein [Candidatus Roizmanbacteria bacterium]